MSLRPGGPARSPVGSARRHYQRQPSAFALDHEPEASAETPGARSFCVPTKPAWLTCKPASVRRRKMSSQPNWPRPRSTTQKAVDILKSYESQYAAGGISP